MMVRRILFVMLTAIAPVLGVLSAEPATADSVITSSFDTETAHPGDTVALTVTFTNPESVDVTFAYLGWIESWPSIYSGLKFTDTGCTGEITSCNHYTVPIAPGASRSVTRTFAIAADSPCGETMPLAFNLYSYRESTAGAFDLIVSSPSVIVLC